MTKFEQFLNKKRREYGEKFDSSDLDKRFVSAFNSGERIEIEDFGEKMKGYVGVTTGWKPVFLLMKTKRSTDSCVTLSPTVTCVKV